MTLLFIYKHTSFIPTPLFPAATWYYNVPVLVVELDDAVAVVPTFLLLGVVGVVLVP